MQNVSAWVDKYNNIKIMTEDNMTSTIDNTEKVISINSSGNVVNYVTENSCGGRKMTRLTINDRGGIDDWGSFDI